MELKEKVVVITGGSKGLGRSLAKLLVGEGARVVICAKKRRELEIAAQQIGALPLVADVTKEGEVKELLQTTIEKFGEVDIWVNNAGVWLPHDYAENINMEEVKKMFEVNVFGYMHGTRTALRHMKAKNSGMILNIISDSALIGKPKSSMYGATKWAIRGFTMGVREENKDTNIAILSFFPGGMKTEIFGEHKPENFDKMMDTDKVAELVIKHLKKDNPDTETVLHNL
jgi:3-oxoacyl-[acyl-carrier protein] reductase